MNDRDRIIDKIRKCLALASSSNEHEAAAALRQARKLMDSHAIDDQDILAAQAGEANARSTATKHPPAWEASLASLVSSAFGCGVLFTSGYWSRRATWTFIGCGAASEIARYAFTILLRQVKTARQEHIRTRLKRCKPETKTRRGDLFCEGWIRGIRRQVGEFAGCPEQHNAVTAYIATRYPELGSLQPRDRNDGRRLPDHEVNDFRSGADASRNTQLYQGVGGQRKAIFGYPDTPQPKEKRVQNL